jgi:DNA-binding XRE family transcriptional regulator
MTPAQCRAARGIARMTQLRLAKLAGVPRNVIIDFELNSLLPKDASSKSAASSSLTVSGRV